MFRPKDQPVLVSCVFTWDKPRAERIAESWAKYYTDVKLGGPAYGDPSGAFVPGRFVKNGVTITSRGCPKKCPWCFVPKREGKIREIEIKPGNIIQDNNLLACSRKHVEAVFAMLAEQKRAAQFKGGIDVTLLKDWQGRLLKQCRLSEIWVACDTPGHIAHLRKANDILGQIPVRKKRCFVMIGYNAETLKQAEERLETVYALGYLPFCQLYQDVDRKEYDQSWRLLVRKWSRPAAYR